MSDPPPPPSPFDLRREMEESVLRDLLGPAGGPEEELVETRVRDRYLVGMLLSSQEHGAPTTADDRMGEGYAADDLPDLANDMQPDMLFSSSCGLTCTIDGQVTAVRVTVRWGRYVRRESATRKTPATNQPMQVWRRCPVGITLSSLPLQEGPLTPTPVHDDYPGVILRGTIRRFADVWLFSLFLVNNQAVPQRLTDESVLFQPELIIEGQDGAAIFRPSPRPVRGWDAAPESHAEREDRMMEMLYRHHAEFATGHGVSVCVDTLPGQPDRATRVATAVVPIAEIPPTTPPSIAEIPALAELTLDMKALALAPPSALPALLAALPAAYGLWIAEQRARIDDPAEGLAEFGEAARESLLLCEQARQRIQEGIDLLAHAPQAARAFQFCNEAMWQQRVHSIAAQMRRREELFTFDDVDIPANRTWFPFQLAFILLNLPALTDLHHPDRADSLAARADLLWFPTGGGKTEAYLGLAAYTLAIRRLQGIVAGRDGRQGVAVLMRYTLRLLTLQQFQRAATLICACETIRRALLARGETQWGHTPFRLGLWVGQGTTPNTTDQSADIVRLTREERRRHAQMAGGGTPRQLTNCPWCGAAIDPAHGLVVETLGAGRGRTYQYCSDPQCLFSAQQSAGEGLPVVVVDEEIYRLLPAMLIATVDKFAQMPWKGATRLLFGRVDSLCERHGFRSTDIDDAEFHPKRGALPAANTVVHAPLRPLDLIIQDELHLISGPLGTLVGLYETAVDGLSTWTVNGASVRPKVIASTATVRRATDQVRALFGRQVAVFPPHGLDNDDNFFARQRAPTPTLPGRRYLGVCAPGRRLKAALIRAYVAYLAAGQQLYTTYGAAADPWMTLVGYFNSLRELGGMLRLVEDDITTRLLHMDDRGFARRSLRVVRELTSRMGATDIPAILDRMEVQFDPVAQQQRQEARQAGLLPPDSIPDPLDVLLATNMLGVGVDVKRLGLMVVAGQPKSTAEYIQATSRVGRAHPGIVCTVFQWARPRDLSHYERFTHYHHTFYQHVEALSVTPFSPRACDRGLSALLVSLIRLEGAEFNDNAHAEHISADHPTVTKAMRQIVQWAGRVTDDETRTRVEADVQTRMTEWVARAQAWGPQRLGYRDQRDGLTRRLLHTPEQGAWDLFTCLNSLRDVEPTANFVLDETGLDEQPPARVEQARRAATPAPTSQESVDASER